MNILIAAGMPADFSSISYDFVIGVDFGNINLINAGILPDLAVGDFDSVNADELKLIKTKAKELIILPAEKDDTDLEVALDVALKRFNQGKIIIAGALGGRMDHMLTNLFLPVDKKYTPFATRISLVNQQNLISYLPAGRHKIKARPGMKYIGFLQIETGNSLAIEGAKYPLKAEDNFKTIYASNEFIGSEMNISIKKGMVMVIFSKDQMK